MLLYVYRDPHTQHLGASMYSGSFGTYSVHVLTRDVSAYAYASLVDFSPTYDTVDIPYTRQISMYIQDIVDN